MTQPGKPYCTRERVENSTAEPHQNVPHTYLRSERTNVVCVGNVYVRIYVYVQYGPPRNVCFASIGKWRQFVSSAPFDSLRYVLLVPRYFRLEKIFFPFIVSRIIVVAHPE